MYFSLFVWKPELADKHGEMYKPEGRSRKDPAEAGNVLDEQGRLATPSRPHWNSLSFGEGKTPHLESLLDARVPGKMGLLTQSSSNTGGEGEGSSFHLFPNKKLLF